jgi:hypothetical protein
VKFIHLPWCWRQEKSPIPLYPSIKLRGIMSHISVTFILNFLLVHTNDPTC